jgi:hypothetical protein
LVLGLSLVNITFAAGKLEIGNRDIISVNRPVFSPFDSIVLGTSATLNIYQDSEAKIQIATDSNVEKYIETNINGNILTIQETKGVSLKPTECIVHVYTPNVSNLSISGSGDILLINTIKTDNLSLRISGSGEIKGTIESNNLQIRISGSGELKLTGTSNEAIIDISGSGDINSEDLKIENAKIKISGSGEVKITVNNKLEGETSGSGSIMYKGNPRIDFSGSGSGKIKAIE